MRLGNLFEEALRQHVRETEGLEVWVPESAMIGTNRVQGAHLDGLTSDSPKPAVVECKFTNSTKGWGDEHTDKIPWEVTIQVQHQLYCTGLQRALVPVLMPWRGRVSVRTYEVRRDEEIIQNLSEKAEDWWAKHIVTGTPPMDTPSMFSLKKQERDEGKSVALASCLLNYYQDALDAVTKAEAYAEEQKAGLLTPMGKVKAEIATFGSEDEATYFKQSRRTLGQGPKYQKHVCAKCGVGHNDSEFRVLRIRKAK